MSHLNDFYWLDNTKVNDAFSYWAPYEPDHANDAQIHHVALNPNLIGSDKWKWIDMNKANPNYYLCESTERVRTILTLRGNVGEKQDVPQLAT